MWEWRKEEKEEGRAPGFEAMTLSLTADLAALIEADLRLAPLLEEIGIAEQELEPVAPFVPPLRSSLARWRSNTVSLPLAPLGSSLANGVSAEAAGGCRQHAAAAQASAST